MPNGGGDWLGLLTRSFNQKRSGRGGAKPPESGTLNAWNRTNTAQLTIYLRYTALLTKHVRKIIVSTARVVDRSPFSMRAAPDPLF